MININDPCPKFKLLNIKGEDFTQNDLLGKITVLFFYPKNFTPGCTKEACSFRDNFESFEKLNCQIIGISGDSENSHSKFQQKHGLPFPTISDKNNELRKKLKLPNNLFGLIPGRVTLIFDENAILKGIYNSQLNTDGHMKYAFQIVETLKRK